MVYVVEKINLTRLEHLDVILSGFTGATTELLGQATRLFIRSPTEPALQDRDGANELRHPKALTRAQCRQVRIHRGM